MTTLPAFNGPVKPLELAHWLRRCEDYFQDDAGGSFSDKEKVHAAGRGLSGAEASKVLYDWFTENQDELEGGSWSDFKSRLKDEAFGKGWRTRALQDFHTTTHEGQTVDQYIKTLQQKKFVIDQNDSFIADETWKTAQEFFYKCHMLFHAPPAVTEQVLKDKVFDNEEELHRKRPGEVQQWLRHYSDRASAPSPTASQQTASKTLIYLGKLNYSPYATNEIFSVTFRENVKSGGRVVVIHQWTKDAAGVEKKNSVSEGTINKAVDIREGVKEIVFFEKEKDKTYYWYKGTISGNTVTITMMNKKGEECVKNIKLLLVS